MNRKYILLLAGIITLVLASLTVLYVTITGSSTAPQATKKADKVYIAAEDGGAVDVIDTASRSISESIDLTVNNNGSSIMYMAHNVQVSPDNNSVWVTANAMGDESDAHGDHGVHSSEESETTPNDQLVVINPNDDTISKRIDIGSGLHLAHVVLTPDGKYAITVSEEKGEVYKIDTSTYQIVQTAKTTNQAGPHGFRISPDGMTAYIALMGAKNLGVLNIDSFTMEYVELDGIPVQTGITPDGKQVLATIYDNKSVAIYDVATKETSYIDLPADSKGPLQLYPTSDSNFAYVADQGNTFNQPDGDTVYKIDIAERKVIQSIKVGTAPHGVVVSPDDRTIYVTNYVSDDVSVIDNVSGEEIAKIATSEKPNGISYWVAN